MAEQQGLPILLDATALTADFLRSRFPTIDAACRARGLDWSKDPIPVTPAAHYWMGGILTDTWGRTSIPGLYAVGEVACTGVHGANRLASNSLLEGLTFGWRCAHTLLSATPIATFDPTWPTFDQDAGNILPIDTELPQNTTLVDRTSLQALMWDLVGIERTRSSLEAAAAQLNHWHADGSTIHALETANLLDLARVMVAAALAREESRGAHFRNDFPETSAAFHHSLVYANKVTVACP
jgi:L-aspartate oxidase